MSKYLMMRFLLVICFGFNIYKAGASVQSVPGSMPESVFELNAESLKNSSKDELEKEMGRSLTFKEKIVLKSVKRKLKKNEHLSGTDALEEVHTDGLAIAGFVIGIVGLFVLGILLGILAIVFSAIALNRIKKEPKARMGRGLAIAGLVLGIVGVLGWLILLAIIATG